jgi:methylated-DNA-[protein]-cysteine S-methyltransferase
MPAAITNNPTYSSGYVLFDTAIGRCALVWRGGLVVGAALPEASDELARQSLARRFPGAVESDPPPFAAAAIDRIASLLAGAGTDLGDIAVEAQGSAFERDVWEAARRIPCGEVRSYGDIAREIGAPGAAQAVGLALGRNPVPIVIPCHRVLAADGRTGGFSAPGGVATKFRILEIEGARRSGEPELFESLPMRVRPA